MNIELRKMAGVTLVAGGIFDLVAGILHPQGARGNGSYRATIAAYLQDPKWPAATWTEIAAFALLAWGVWLLIDTGVTRRSAIAHGGARLLQVGLTVMIVEAAVEIAARPEAAVYAAGGAAPLVWLTAPLQTIGWLAFGAGFAALALGARSVVPRPVGILGAVGGLGMAVGGVLTEGFRLVDAGPLFILGALTALWLVWAGVSLVRAKPVDATDPVPAGHAAQRVSAASPSIAP
jgi:hypothetical protein